MFWTKGVLSVGLGLLSVSPAVGQVTTRVSVSSAGVQARDSSWSPSVSSDGRWVAFGSLGDNLIPGDLNGRADVFIHDGQLGTTECVSLDPNGAMGNEASNTPSMTPDGRFIAFWSRASNLVSGDSNGFDDIFVRDRLTGTTELVSVDSGGLQGNDNCGVNPRISPDGRFVVFTSPASNLVPGDFNAMTDVFVRDRLNATTELVSVDSNGTQADQNCDSPGISADGRYVVFCSTADNLVPGDTNQSYDVFVHDRLSGTTECVSLDVNGAPGDSDSTIAVISANGRFVAFESWASNMVSGVPNNPVNHYLRDRWNGTTEVVGLDDNDHDLYWRGGDRVDHAISEDGRFVVFRSWALDTNHRPDLFIRDRQDGSVEAVSVNSGGGAAQGSSYGSGSPSVSDDGRFIAFSASPTNLVPDDTNECADAFLRDRQLGAGTTSFTSLCDPGTGNVISCPCSNPPSGAERGCDNSVGSGGASLTASGNTQLSADGLIFTTSGEAPAALSILAQGSALLPNGVVYGQGVRCVGGTIRRLFTKAASGGSMRAPDFAADDPPVSVQSAQKGDVIQPGQSRYYLVYYRDPTVLGGCPASSAFNATQTGEVSWSP